MRRCRARRRESTISPTGTFSPTRFEIAEDQRNTVGALLALEQSRIGDDVFEVVLFLGIRKGLQKGRADGQRALLAKLLKLKFGSLDAAAEARLASGTPAQLGLWAERVLSASSLDEIWS